MNLATMGRSQIRGFASDLRKVEGWPATVEQVRNLLMTEGVCQLQFARGGIEEAIPPDEALTNSINEGALRALLAGRLIFIGHLSNEVIKTQSARAAGLYRQGHIGHPFKDVWLLYHTWEECGSLYLVHPLEEDRPNGGVTAVAEISAYKMEGRNVLVLGDRAEFDCDEVGKYTGDAWPSPWRQFQNKTEALMGTISSLADPVILAMLLMATKGVPNHVVEPPAKLQKARRKSGKHPLPSHVHVETKDYVTALLARGRPGGDRPRGTGTHASPIPHLRRGHPRTLENGQTIWVQDALVNFGEGEGPIRSHYDVRAAVGR